MAKQNTRAKHCFDLENASQNVTRMKNVVFQAKMATPPTHRQQNKTKRNETKQNKTNKNEKPKTRKVMKQQDKCDKNKKHKNQNASEREETNDLR